MRGSITQGFVTPGLYALFGDAGIETVGTVRDYVCDYLPDIQDCIDAGASKGGGTPNVRTRSGSSPDLDPETSDLYNLGFSLKFLDGEPRIRRGLHQRRVPRPDRTDWPGRSGGA